MTGCTFSAFCDAVPVNRLHIDTLGNMRDGTDNLGTAFKDLLEPHLDRLYRLSFRLAGNKPEAEDLFQDVLVKIYPRMNELVEIEEPGPWLCRVMYNHFIDNRRRFARQRLVAISEDRLPPGRGIEEMPGDLDPAMDADRRDNIMRLDSALQQLSDDHRLVVLLHDTEGYKLHEIEALTGTPIGTLKSRLHRARARLREILDTDGTKDADESCLALKRTNA
jgi:RNA polymerase sigma factor (sigma-70 family)